MTKNRVKELAYYLFFGLMTFAKGIGLDSGKKIYYILSAAACLCVGCKLIVTKYRAKQLAAMAVLCLVAGVAYIQSGRMGIVLTVLAIIGLKDMDVRKLFRLGLAVYGCSFAFTVVLAWIGAIRNPVAVHVKGGMELFRWGMGYSTGNIFHVSYFMLTVFLCYAWKRNYDARRMAGLMAGNLLVFLYSLSYTGAAVTAFYLLLNLYAAKREGALDKAERILCLLPLPLCLLFSFLGPFLLEYPAVQKLDGLLQARLTFSAYYLQNQPVTWFGGRMKDVPNFWIIMDNGYVYFLMTFGIAAFLLFCAGYGLLIDRYRREGRRQELVIICSFLLYGIMEQFISNAFMNLSLLFMGEILFGAAEGEATHEEEDMPDAKGNRACGFIRRRWTGGLILGAAVAGIYLSTVPGKEYVLAPLDSVPYVDARSVEIRTVNEKGTKDGLRERIAACREMIMGPEALGAAIRGAGLKGKISEKDLEEAMDIDIPVYIQNDGYYHIFRIRVLELYGDIADEEYGELLEQLLKPLRMPPQGAGDEFYAAEIVGYTVEGDIYAERVYKSAGEERIEHIRDKEGCRIEKGGNAARLEHIRAGVFWGILVCAVWLLFTGGIARYNEERKRAG